MNSSDSLGDGGDGSGRSSHLLQAGNMLGPYRIEAVIAQGGMGTVYHAEHIRLGRSVALKVLDSEYEDRRELLSRFITEARAVNQIDQENIVEITDFIEDRSSGLYAIVMEHLHGVDLLELLGDGTALNLSRAVAIATQIASALEAAHQSGIIHRDLKPDNIFLADRHGRRNFVKILDFGVAKLLKDQVEVNLSAHKTTPGTMLGTPQYMSPEQACGNPVDHRTDLYGLGVILYQMVTGRVPFKGKNIAEIVGKQMTAAPLPPNRYADLPQTVPPRLEALILACLEKEPEARPQSMTAVKQELQAITEDLDATSNPAAPTPAPQAAPLAPRWIALWVLTAVVCLALGALGHALIATGDEPEPSLTPAEEAEQAKPSSEPDAAATWTPEGA